MKYKLAFSCASVLLLFAVTFLFFSVRKSDYTAWAFMVVAAVLTTLLCIINSFVLLYLILKK
jgi:hypothetical protein